jgi:RNA polymerase sigma-70 factor, ECF subfamily
MEAVAATAAPADEAADARTQAGDGQAFIALYGPHFEGVYDYVLRVVRDRAVAAEVVVETFAKARRAFPEQGNQVSAWLFTTARACALDALRYRRDRDGSEREALDFTRVDGDRVPDASVVFDRELVELVWDTAASLSLEDYSLLALEVRHDLSADAIGEQLGSNGAVSARLVRTRFAFDEQVTSELVARRGRHNCTELETLAAGEDGRSLSQHIRRCSRCQESKDRFVSPTDVLGGLAPIAPDALLRREVFAARGRRRRFGRR